MSNIFCVQDRTGTAAQLTLDAPPVDAIELTDTGVYSGPRWDGQPVTLPFTVGQIVDSQNFGITTMHADGSAGNVMQSGWPENGLITWLTGANVNLSPSESRVIQMSPANAYTTADYFAQYFGSRGVGFPESPTDVIEFAIVRASDYVDQRWRFKGVKLLQFLTENPMVDPSFGLIDPWLSLQGFIGSIAGPTVLSIGLTPSLTFQHTEWPRQGCVDFNGDTVYGVPIAVKAATCELAMRTLSGTVLQPDYDSSMVIPGGVVSSVSEEVGPIKRTKSFDTKLGLGFFPSYPQVERILRKAGLLAGGGGRTIIR